MDTDLGHFRKLVDALAIPAWLIDLNGVIDTANAAFRDRCSVLADATQDQTIHDLVRQEDGREVTAACTALFAGAADGIRLPLRLRQSAGAAHAVDCLMSPLRNGERIIGVLCQLAPQGRGTDAIAPPAPSPTPLDPDSSSLPTRGRKHAFDQMRKQRDAARETAEILSIANIEGRVVPWTRTPEQGESWFGHNLNALLGLPPKRQITWSEFRTLIHPQDLAAVAAAYDAVERGDTDVFSKDFRVRHADGTWRLVSSKGRKLDRSGAGLPYLVCGCLIDITEHKMVKDQLAQALREADAAHVAALTREKILTLTSLRGGIGHFTVIPGSERGEATDETYRLLGYDPGAFASTDAAWRDLIHPDDLAEAIAAMDALKSGQANIYEHVHRMRHGDGSYHWYRAIAGMVPREDPNLYPLLAGAIINIDQIVENEAKLAETAAVAQRARDRLNTLANKAPGALFESHRTVDDTVTLPYYSAKLPDLLGVTPNDLSTNGMNAYQHIHPDDMPMVSQRIAQARNEAMPIELRYRLLHPSKGLRWMMMSSVPQAHPDGGVTWYGNVIDITDQLEIENRAAAAAAEVRQAHNRLSSIAEVVPVGLYEILWHGPHQFEFTYTSAHYEQLLGYSREEIQSLQMGILERVHPEDAARYAARLEDCSQSLTSVQDRIRINHPVHGLRWCSVTSTPKLGADGTVVWTGAMVDVTGDVQREADLRQAHALAEQMRAENEHQALHDGLTGLPNRRYYDQMLAKRIDEATRGRAKDCALIRIDLDHFKYVNDTLGHEAGDQVLLRVADVLRASLRPKDFAARIGGDEFSILLAPGTPRAGSEAIIERIHAALRVPMTYDGRPCRFGASFGLADTEDLKTIGPEIQIFADAALYRAKESGRNRLEVFSPELHRDILSDRRTASELHDALENDQFMPYFQPQISAKDGALVGIEALLRWRHPTRGILAPDAFMHVAEQLRIVPEIDRLMMEKSRRVLARWRSQNLHIPKISFNISSGRMHDPNVIDHARALVAEDTRVTFELLESILIEEESDVFRFHLDLIRDAGIEIEIDDFGSGHASIIGLMEIAPDALKIDRRIIAPVTEDIRSRNLTGAIVEIAETLGIATVAEGVETQQQADILRAIGCDVLQGYLFARPLSEDDFLTYATGAGRLSA